MSKKKIVILAIVIFVVFALVVISLYGNKKVWGCHYAWDYYHCHKLWEYITKYHIH